MSLFKKKNKEVEKKCKNCLLYNIKNQYCSVLILHNGEKINLPTSPDDDCFFEQEFESVNENGIKENWKQEINQVRMWVEDENGNQADNGIVKIEYPEGFFGNENNII